MNLIFLSFQSVKEPHKVCSPENVQASLCCLPSPRPQWKRAFWPLKRHIQDTNSSCINKSVLTPRGRCLHKQIWSRLNLFTPPFPSTPSKDTSRLSEKPPLSNATQANWPGALVPAPAPSLLPFPTQAVLLRVYVCLCVGVKKKKRQKKSSAAT